MIGASQCIQVAVIKCGQVCILCAIIYHMKHCFLCVCEFMMLETPKRRHYCHLLAVFLSDTLAITRCNCLLACMHSCTRSCSVGFCRWIADDVCEYIFQFHGSTLQPAGLFSLVLRLVQSSLGGQFPGTRHHLVKMIIIALSSYTLFFVQSCSCISLIAVNQYVSLTRKLILMVIIDNNQTILFVPVERKSCSDLESLPFFWSSCSGFGLSVQKTVQLHQVSFCFCE